MTRRPPPAIAASSSPRKEEVESSLELLDRVLSEFDDVENGNNNTLTGALPVVERRTRVLVEHQQAAASAAPPPPPPPSVARDIIAALLPRGEEGERRRRRHEDSLPCQRRAPQSLIPLHPVTIPKTRHGRALCGRRKLREEEAAYFSDDSLELEPPPPPACAPPPPTDVPPPSPACAPLPRCRPTAWEVALDTPPPSPPDLCRPSGSPVSPPPPPPARPRQQQRPPPIAWELPASPGSTRVIRRRRKSSPPHPLEQQEEWPEPPEGCRPVAGGTYVIRRGRRRQRQPLEAVAPPPPVVPSVASSSVPPPPAAAFEGVKSLLKEGLIEGLDEAPPDFSPPLPPVCHVAVQVGETTDESDSDRPAFVNGMTDTSSNEALMAELRKEYGGESYLPVSQVHVSESTGEEFKVKVEIVQENSGAASLDSMGSSLDLSPAPSPVNGLPSEPSSPVNVIHHEPPPGSLSPLEPPCNTPDDDPLTVSPVDVVQEISTACINIVHKSSPVLPRPSSPGQHDPPPQSPPSPRSPTPPRSTSPVELKPANDIPPRPSSPLNSVQHDFGPLPPSPVQEDDDEFKSSPSLTPSGTSNERRESFYRCRDPGGGGGGSSDPLGTRLGGGGGSGGGGSSGGRGGAPPSSSSLRTRSMDAGFTRQSTRQTSSHPLHHLLPRAETCVPERRTLELAGPPRRRTAPLLPHQQLPGQQQGGGRSVPSPGFLQVSSSLPETPIFARGCDIPRTPHRRAPDLPTNLTNPRHVSTRTTTSHSGGGASLTEVMTGSELLRLTGGPGRGWYPRAKSRHRPASVEHLDHLALFSSSAAAGGGGTTGGGRCLDLHHLKQPQTLPPNITPKFYRSPRDALRRVTSLLIRRGAGGGGTNNGSSGSGQKKEPQTPDSETNGRGGIGRKKSSLFSKFWRRSRHYSLEQ